MATCAVSFKKEKNNDSNLSTHLPCQHTAWAWKVIFVMRSCDATFHSWDTKVWREGGKGKWREEGGVEG